MSRNTISGLLAFGLGFCLMFAFKGSSDSIARYSSEKAPGAWESTEGKWVVVPSGNTLGTLDK